MKRTILLSMLICMLMIACGHEHTQTDATCTMPKTCNECDEFEVEAQGHAWEEATCTEAKICMVCEETEGKPLGHAWVEASCMTAKNCSACNAIEGEAQGHTWREASYISPKTCLTCGKSEGNPLPVENPCGLSPAFGNASRISRGEFKAPETDPCPGIDIR